MEYTDEMYFLPEHYGYKNCGIVISREKINYILDEKGVYYEAHCLMKTCDELLKQYFTHIELVGVIMLPKDWTKARNIYDLIVSSFEIKSYQNNNRNQSFKCSIKQATKNVLYVDHKKWEGI